jgi:hypothetical protein
MVKGSEAMQVMVVEMIASWCRFFKNDAEQFVRTHVEIFRELYEGLPRHRQEKFPGIVMNSLPTTN